MPLVSRHLIGESNQWEKWVSIYDAGKDFIYWTTDERKLVEKEWYKPKKIVMEWDELEYWRTGEWQVIQERLDELDKIGGGYTPKRDNIFNALEATPFEKVDVVLIGQDPYPDPKYATGLAFDVNNGTKIWPPTLVNIHKELCDDMGYPWPKKPSLKPWAARGVLLWNATPTVQSYKAGHQPILEFNGKFSGSYWYEWEPLTEEIIKTLSDKREGIVFIFWGARASKFEKFVDSKKHKTFHAVHPSPLSANRGWWKSRTFSSVNKLLKDLGKGPIDWRTE